MYIWRPLGCHCEPYPVASLSPMVSMWSDLKRETPLEGSNPLPITMTNIDNLQQLQTRIVEME